MSIASIALLARVPAATAEEGGAALRPPAPQSVDFYRRSWAVVVGIDRFRDNRISPLSYAVNDARSVARALVPLGFAPENIVLLENERATRAEIERVLSGVVRRATGPQDRLLIFFAMHGVTAALPHGGEEGYLLTHDADLDDLPITALSMQQLKQIGQRIPAKHILVAVDACYGGYSLVRAQAPAVADRRYLDLVIQSRTIQIVTAGRRDQPVIEDQGHGVFTRTLLRGLEGHADQNGDGVIMFSELGAWMHPRVAQASDYKQDMQWGSLDGEGQFVFVLPKLAAATTPPRLEPPARPAPAAAPPLATLPPSVATPPVAPSPSTTTPPVAPLPSTATAPAPVTPSPAVKPSPPAVTPQPPAIEPPPTTKPTDTRVASIPPDPRLDALVGTWEGWMSAQLAEGFVRLSVSRSGNQLVGTVVLSSVRNRGAGAVGMHDSYALTRLVGTVTELAVTPSDRPGRLSARDADGTFVFDGEVAKNRMLSGRARVAGQQYDLWLQRK